MPNAKYTGAPMGGGNPPGQYSDSYLSRPEGSGESHFVRNPSYRSPMHVGIDESAPTVGNQPKERSTGSVNWKKKPALR